MPPLLDLLLPPRCLSCRRGGLEPLCDPCGDRLEPDGQPWVLAPGVVTVSPFVYDDPLSVAVKRVKTDALLAGARALRRLLDPHLPADVVRTWVPATPARRRRRGIDLPEVLAGPSARRLLVATGDRPDHGTADARTRLSGAVGGWVAVGRVPSTVVLVDDVRATGATLLAAATTLRAAGARRVLAVSLAASPGRPSAARRRRDGAADPGPATSAGSGRWS